MLQLLEQAIKMASEIEDDGRHFRLAAIGVRKDGAKVRSTNLRTKEPDPNVHAESRMTRKLGHGGTVYVARVSKNGEAAMSKPCPDCERLMRVRGVKKVFYTIAPNEYGCLVF